MSFYHVLFIHSPSDGQLVCLLSSYHKIKFCDELCFCYPWIYGYFSLGLHPRVSSTYWISLSSAIFFFFSPEWLLWSYVSTRSAWKKMFAHILANTIIQPRFSIKGYFILSFCSPLMINEVEHLIHIQVNHSDLPS